MYLRILKKDLKRKKTMNIILLLFIILATMFVSGSINNIITVTTALDYYFEKEGMSDYFAATMDKAEDVPIAEILEGIPEIDSYGIEHILYISPENLIYEGKQLGSMENTSLLHSFEDAKLNYFDSDDQALESIEPGQVYISGKCIRKNNLEIGDELTIQLGEVSETFEIAGSFKDAALGSDMMGMTRFIISESDFEKFVSDEAIASMYGGSLCYINTGDTEAVEQVLSGQDNNIIFLGSVDMLKMTYIMDMVVAGVLLVVSVCLILIAFVVLRFTISFTLTEEYREIGVMKAIGIRNLKIRSLYLIKYFMLALMGAVIGFGASIPFGEMLLQSVSQSMVMGTENSLLINILCSLAVIGIILLFCYTCTGKVKKYTPVDAIRNGTTGERFQKKGILRLNQSPLSPTVFLAANDVLSSPRRFGTVILTFTLCLSMVLIPINTVNTLKSDGLVTSFALTESDVYLSDEGEQMGFMTADGRERLEQKLEELEQTLAENGMPAECVNEIMIKPTLVHGDKVCKSQAMQGIGTTTDQYVYFEGTPPQNETEIAVTKLIAEKLDARIGDTITIRQSTGDREYLITALFQSMNNMGEGVRLHEQTEVDFLQAAGFFAYQINFTDSPDKREIENRIEKIKEIYDTDKVYTAGEYVDTIVGVSDILDSVRALVLAIVLIIIILITVLMERSFITKERGEIAILKAIGFRNGKVVAWHTMRFGIVSILSTIISLLLLKPLLELTITPIFRMMGADFGVKYEIVPLEVYVIYPLIVLIVTILGAFLTALYTRSITASETANIE